MKIEDLKGEDNWRTGRGRNESQVGQVLFYLLAVQLKCIKEDKPPRQLLGVHIEGDEVYKYYCMTILLLKFFALVSDGHCRCHCRRRWAYGCSMPMLIGTTPTNI